MTANKINVTEFDIFYLSYDEPKKELFWADLLNKVPWAKRVDGVKGFDNAHKECARQSETNNFLTVDGDNIVDERFFNEEVIISEDSKDKVFSWAGKNVVNGLVYGNGGIKLWSKDFVLNMKTHENAEDPDHSVDFCWFTNYIQMNDIFSEVHINQSAFQAFRSGFREGVKMSLLEGRKPNPKKLEEQIYIKNFQRLLIWCSIGADVEFGLWAIYGARLGCYMLNCTDWDHSLIRDYDWLDSFYKDKVMKDISSETDLEGGILTIGQQLKDDLHLDVAELTPTQSKFFKKVYVNPPRVGAMVTENGKIINP